MNRRAFVTGLGAVLAAPVAAGAQQAARVWKIGFLGGTTPPELVEARGWFLRRKSCALDRRR